MDIHKPKAAHSWREFLVEIGTIICGILIALGLEQGLEWLHTEHEIAETRHALNAEIAANSNASIYGVAELRCLVFASDRYIAWAKGGPRLPFAGGLYPLLQSTAWDASRGGPVLRMPTEERLRYARYYGGVENARQLITGVRERSVLREQYTRLDRLDPDQAKRLIELVNGSRTVVVGTGWNEVLLTAQARKMGIEPGAVDPLARSLVESFCRTVGAPTPSFQIERDTSAYSRWALEAIGDSPSSGRQ